MSVKEAIISYIVNNIDCERYMDDNRKLFVDGNLASWEALAERLFGGTIDKVIRMANGNKRMALLCIETELELLGFPI